MIITRSPLRVGLFGGGSDFPAYFNRRPGAVLGFAINSYVWVSGTNLKGLQDYNFRASYRQVETHWSAHDFEHPLVKSCLTEHWQGGALDLSITADLPSNSGLGTSSACAVAMIHMVHLLQGVHLARSDLARLANQLERVVLSEAGGYQDPYHSVYGGLNLFEFSNKGVLIRPVSTNSAVVKQFFDSLWLVPVGKPRLSSLVHAEQKRNLYAGELDTKIGRLVEFALEAFELLSDPHPSKTGIVKKLGYLLDESWIIKRSLSVSVSSSEIDALYDSCIENGAIGGKLCGAGAGGYLLVCVPTENNEKFLNAFKHMKLLKVALDNQGIFHTLF
jgi:D-glycero-alpha-D-manno-heptose-7-phosphate kinase